MTFIKDLQNISRGDVGIAGGKGASLGEMTNRGLPVPSGFVILSNAFEKFLDENNLRIEINAIGRSIKKKDMRSIEKASEKIQALLWQSRIPEEVADEIHKGMKKLGARFVAVRSSATAEDSAHAAWAGQLESYLNTTEEQLLEKVKKCWASLFTPRAIFYREKKGLCDQTISVAVVVQKMVKSEVSGTIFSVHPVTQDKNQIIMEAGVGLGEAVVSGKITPDSYVVEKDSWRILDKRLCAKKSGQKIQLLSDQEIIKLAKLAVKIEKHFSFPVDIEWAKEKNRFFLLQSRPLTTLRSSGASSGTAAHCHHPKLLNYLKSQKWFFGVRADESLLFYSAKTGGDAHIKRAQGMPFAETLLIPLKKNKPIRVFHLEQAKNFHAVSRKKILKDPRILSALIKQDDALYKKMEGQGKKLLFAIKKNDENESIKLFHKILSLYEKASAHFIIIFSLGLQLAGQTDHLKSKKSILKAHDHWRNSVALKEETLGEHLFHFFTYLITKKKLKLDPLLLMKFLTAHEVKAWLKNKLTNKKVKQKIASRKKHEFVYLHLKNEKQEVIDDASEIKKIQTYFLKLNRDFQKSSHRDEISGQVAYRLRKQIRGKVVVIKDKVELQNKHHLIDGKILVAIQTTPHFIPYAKKAKAIITDEGGLTCHAAIIAREFRIPCVIGTKTATHLLKDNDVIEINMNNGVIKKEKI